ncbi:IS3 family transposase [Salmonella enterica]|nr:IS3 family transposase [Salmonella enterica]
MHLDLRDSGQQCGVNRVWRLMKRERIKKKIYGTREEARSDIFDYIEMFYNSKRRHGSSDQMSPTEYENQYYQRLRSV